MRFWNTRYSTTGLGSVSPTRAPVFLEYVSTLCHNYQHRVFDNPRIERTCNVSKRTTAWTARRLPMRGALIP